MAALKWKTSGNKHASTSSSCLGRSVLSFTHRCTSSYKYQLYNIQLLHVIHSISLCICCEKHSDPCRHAVPTACKCVCVFICIRRHCLCSTQNLKHERGPFLKRSSYSVLSASAWAFPSSNSVVDSMQSQSRRGHIKTSFNRSDVSHHQRGTGRQRQKKQSWLQR